MVSPEAQQGAFRSQVEQDLDIATTAETALDIARATDDVFAYLSDFTHQPEWSHTCLTVEPLTDGPLRVGSLYALTERQDLRWDKRPMKPIVDRDGEDSHVTVHVVGLQPDREIAWRAAISRGPFLDGTLGDWRFILEPIGERITRVRLRYRLDGSRPALMAWIDELRRRGYPLDVLQRQADRAMHNLRTILEGRVRDHGDPGRTDAQRD